MDGDFALAVALQEQLDEDERGKTQAPPIRTDISIVDNYWELADPNPNIHELFLQFDAMYFKSSLNNAGVEVKWSPRMTLCAGVCSYEGRGGLCSVRLSRPLLKYRPRRDLVQTLLHEMIHAYLFVAERNTDHDAHGPQFLFHMERINKLSGAKITVYHTFHDEVNEYRQHWWKCDGPCQHKPPYYGVVKRAMNRPPSSKDSWWAKHQETCGGTYIKIKEPDDYKKKGKTNEEENSKTLQGKNGDIKKMLEKSCSTNSSTLKQSSQKTSAGFSGTGHTLGGVKQESLSKQFSRPSEAAAFAAQKRHSQTNGSPVSKKMKGSSKGKERHKEIAKVDRSSIKEITTTNRNSTSPSKLMTASKDIRDLYNKGTKCTSFITDSAPCSSSSTVSHDEDIIDLTDDKACPICGFTSPKPDLLSMHINECLDRFAS